EHAKNLPLQIQLDDPIVQAVTHINRIFACYIVQAPRRADIGPLTEELAVAIKDLDPLIRPVGDIHATFGIEYNIVNHVELAVVAAFLPPMREIFGITIELNYARVDVAIGDIEIAVRGEGDVSRFVERILAVVVTRGTRTAHSGLSSEDHLQPSSPIKF